MSSGIYVALSGAISRMRELDVLANNLANVETPGYKRALPVFAVALEASVADITREPVAGAPGRVFPRTAGTHADLSSGSITHTGAPLDLAIEGPGFFVVEGPDGERYTRAGSFQVNPDGALATADGFAVLGAGGPIRAGDRPVKLTGSGALVDDTGRELGRLRVVTFEKPERLEKVGANLLRAPRGTEPEDVRDPALVEASLEASNVRPVEELASLVLIQRSFEAAMRMIQAQDQATSQLIREVSS